MFKKLTAVAAIALASVGTTQAAQISFSSTDSDIFVNIVKINPDLSKGDSMLINTGLSAEQVATGAISGWTSDVAMTSAINTFLGGADAQFYATGSYLESTSALGGLRYVISDQSLPTPETIYNQLNSFVNNKANVDPAFSAAADPWLADIAPGNQLHWQSTDLFGVAAGGDLDTTIAYQVSYEGTGFDPSGVSTFAQGFWSLSSAGELNYSLTPTSAVPVPAAAWLFGSALVGLASVARRRR